MFVLDAYGIIVYKLSTLYTPSSDKVLEDY